MTVRRIAILALAGLTPTGAALAHHGWAWTTGENIELVGVIQEARLGNPHGILEVDVEGDTWIVEVGQPWRNERAGLKDGDLAPGVEIRAIGERWLRQPTVAYQLAPHVLVQWLETDAEIAAVLGPRLREEGLAMLGPDRILRLSRTGQPAAREAARAWSHRLTG